MATAGLAGLSGLLGKATSAAGKAASTASKIMPLASAAIGAGQMIAGTAQKAKADRMMVNTTDPAQLALLEETRRKQAQLEGGTDALTQANLQEIEQNTAATQRGLSNVTAGNVGGTVSALLGAQKLAGQGVNQAYGAASVRGTEMGKLGMQLSKEIAQRKLDVQHYAQQQKRTQAATNMQQGFGNFMGGLSTVFGMNPKTA
jgi:hypothetical protein